MLKGEHLWFRYGRHLPWVVQDQTLQVELGEVVGLMAPSGFGKTTLAKLLAGYLTPSQGRVSVTGQPLPRRGYCPVQLVFQHPEQAVNPHWRIAQVLREGPPPQPEVLHTLGISPSWLNRYPHELSGGELQRVVIARVLNPQTRYLIADEMTAMLDANTQALIWQAVLAYGRAHQMGLLVISHDRFLLERLCSRYVIMTSHDPYLVERAGHRVVRMEGGRLYDLR
ncbi:MULTISPECIES: ABC transporter ATP-binding protein [unclassified Synechococcus]|jgi:peptide/nickel transport system ATP-binding protein/Fe3+-transporting ATPase|uniref:ABC transporter ATP-binding protein n=3 Tax=Synechococcus TaxID=1129 RepID=UPI0000695077|nr:ATP-binding cassette domain-containing protein [Synechococcus sp. JA-2-3B'a(2-13)]ABD02836.1 peptide/opine/nickel uptake ABC transporter (PepT) family, ATP-binding protein [Synechococcus sp. JA-2-3B'a(2-13)]